jgi:hypothetical protein
MLHVTTWLTLWVWAVDPRKNTTAYRPRAGLTQYVSVVESRLRFGSRQRLREAFLRFVRQSLAAATSEGRLFFSTSL